MYVHTPSRTNLPGSTSPALLAPSAGGKIAAILVLMVFSYFWIGLDPLPDSTLIDPTKAYGGSSNRLNQIVVILMAGIVLFAVLGKDSRGLLLQPRFLLFAVFGWFFFVALFAGDPGTAFRRTVFAALVCMFASAVLLLPKSRDQFVTLVTLVLTAMLALAYLTVTVLPHVGVHQATDPLEAQLAGDWRAHFGHKNAAAIAMVFTFFFGLYLMKVRSFLLGAAIALLAFVFLIKTGSKTSTALMPAILVFAWIFERFRMGRLVLIVLSLSAVNAVLMSAASSRTIQSLLASMGIDPTFTERTSIWQLAMHAIGNSPLVGYGMQSFWQTNALFRSSSSLYTWAVTAANSHNGYVDLFINGGVIAFLLVTIWLVVLPVRYLSRALQGDNDRYLTRLYMRIWLYTLFIACLESPFFVNAGPIWFTMLIAVFGLRLQAYEVLVVSSAKPARVNVVEPSPSGPGAAANTH